MWGMSRCDVTSWLCLLALLPIGDQWVLCEHNSWQQSAKGAPGASPVSYCSLYDNQQFVTVRYEQSTQFSVVHGPGGAAVGPGGQLGSL